MVIPSQLNGCQKKKSMKNISPLLGVLFVLGQIKFKSIFLFPPIISFSHLVHLFRNISVVSFNPTKMILEISFKLNPDRLNH